MEELARLEDERGNPAYLSDGKEAGGKRERIASNEMCTFLILNISSLRLLPVNYGVDFLPNTSADYHTRTA